jgi:hypothetical protein
MQNIWKNSAKYLENSGKYLEKALTPIPEVMAIAIYSTQKSIPRSPLS